MERAISGRQSYNNQNFLDESTNIVTHVDCLTLLRLSVSLLGKQDWVKTRYQIGVLDLIQHLMENRLRHASGPVRQYRVSYIYCFDQTQFDIPISHSKIIPLDSFKKLVNDMAMLKTLNQDKPLHPRLDSSKSLFWDCSNGHRIQFAGSCTLAHCVSHCTTA